MNVTGIGRDGEYAKCLVVYTDSVPTDDELRALHEQLRDDHADNLAMMVGRLARLVDPTKHVAHKQAMDLLARYGYEFKPHAR